MIDPSEIKSFVTVAQERSFSVAAIRLGLAQSAVSQKVKRLEDQLAIHLLDRTSRRVHLSVEGAQFLPHAHRLLEVHEDVLHAAEHIRGKRGSTLLLGGDNFLIEERLKLVEHFLELNPTAQVDVHQGGRTDLFHRLSQGDLDAVVTLALPGQPELQFEHIHVERRGCHVAFPPDHPLASRDSITFGDLHGLPLVISPGRQNAAILSVVHDHLVKFGISLIAAPEADRRVIEQFAHVRELPYMRWYPQVRPRHEFGGFVVLPVSDNTLFTDLLVYFQKGKRRDATQLFTRAIQDLVAIAAAA